MGGSCRSSVTDREVCVYTSRNTNRRCRLDKKIKGKGATQINQDQYTNGPMQPSLSLLCFVKLTRCHLQKGKQREGEGDESKGRAEEGCHLGILEALETDIPWVFSSKLDAGLYWWLRSQVFGAHMQENWTFR